MSASPPSREKRVWLGYFAWRKCSNDSAATSRSSSAALGVGSQVGMVAARLDALLQPRAPLLVGDRQILDAERAAVGLGERRDELAERAAGAAAERLPVHDPVEIASVEAELLELQERVVTWAVAERIEVGDEVAELTVGVDELGDLGAPASERRCRRARDRSPRRTEPSGRRRRRDCAASLGRAIPRTPDSRERPRRGAAWCPKPRGFSLHDPDKSDLLRAVFTWCAWWSTLLPSASFGSGPVFGHYARRVTTALSIQLHFVIPRG